MSRLILPRIIWTSACLLLLSVVQPAAAQEADDASQRFREAVSLDTDIAVTKKLKTAEDYLAARQWESAIEVLEGIIQKDAGTLVPAGPGRYVSAGTYSHLLLARMPDEGLALYRRKTDPQSRQWYDEGRKNRDENLLRRILQHTYAGSYGDDTLSTLGEWAWERGEINIARRYWSQLLPSGDSMQLQYPDPQPGGAAIVIRLLLCRLVEGNVERAGQLRERLIRDFPEATGTVAGKTGRYAELAAELISESANWRQPTRSETVHTFGGNIERDQILPSPVDVGAEQWSVRFSDRERTRFKLATPRAAFLSSDPLSVFPVTDGRTVFYNDADRIYARDIRTGKPAWPGAAADDDDAVIYQLHDNLFPVNSRPAIGVPRFSMTIHDGRLYARMGSPITSRSERELIADFESVLVVLDLDPERGQGKLLAKISAERFGRGDAPWSFEGSPVVAENRLYVALRRSQPHLQLNVACFDTDNGRLLWNRKVCAAVSNIGRVNNLVSHQLLTLAEDKLFVSSDLGAVAALDARDGLPLWVLTYDSLSSDTQATLSDHTRQGLLPCLYRDGTVFAAPNDSNQVFAVDAQSGTVKWTRQLNDPIRHLLGVGEGNLILSGNSLWGLNAETGQVAWGRDNPDPEFYGYGRGLLVGDAVWWPTRDAIEVRSQRTGHRIHRQPVPLNAHGTTPEPNTGGNLLIADNYLLVAQADRLVVYGESPLPQHPPRREVSAVTSGRKK